MINKIIFIIFYSKIPFLYSLMFHTWHYNPLKKQYFYKLLILETLIYKKYLLLQK